MIAVPVALAAAVLLGAGFVLQQSQAATEPAERALHPSILLDLLRKPRWLSGIATMVAGQVLGAVALARGGLALVEPLLSTNLLFALVIGSVARRRSPCRQDLVGAVVLSAGMAGFLVIASPGTGSTGNVAPLDWLVSLGAVVAAAAILTAAGRSATGPRRGAAFAGAAGILFGLQDALTATTLHDSTGGLGEVLTSWSPYLLLAAAVAGLLLAQSAFQAAPLSSSLPPATAAEPVTGIAIGVGVFAGSINDHPLALAGEGVCLAALLVGLWIVASSPRHLPHPAPAR